MCLEPPGLIQLAVDPITLETAVPQCAPSATGYPSFMGPGVPKERMEAIRSADLESLEDPEFINAIRWRVPAICCPRYSVHQ